MSDCKWKTLVAIWAGIAGSTVVQAQTPAALIYDPGVGAIRFAAGDLKAALQQNGYSVTDWPLSDPSGATQSVRIILTTSDASVPGKPSPAGLAAQGYAIQRVTDGTATNWWVIGKDAPGALYGGLELAEAVKLADGLAGVTPRQTNPYLANRGIKFNIPLDQRTPSHDDRGTAAQANVGNMWELSFWKEYLDELARTRYNVVSLWSRHPFPSLIQVPEYPDVALADVYNAGGRVKQISISQKIAIWRQIMDYACDRGIEFHIITWSIHMDGAKGKYGITEDINNPTAKDYLRKSVKQLFLTYPRLAGIGVTAGENMKDINDNDKEQWLWETYGLGVQDLKRIQPDRPILFIHRHWMTSFDKISSRFKQLSDGFDMEFKYAQAHMYSSYAPPFAREELLPKLPSGIKTWWNIRNDDLYNLRWGDPEYVKQFMLHFPDKDRTAGYLMGSDRYVWGRESISKNPQSPRQLENSKHWYSFLLWGRLGYDPNTPTELFEGLIRHRFPGVPSGELFAAWKSASQIAPLVTRFHYFGWDYQWWVEACHSTGYGNAIAGFHTVRDFITGPVMRGSGLLTIPKYRDNVLGGKTNPGTTPVQVADQLEQFASVALAKTSGLSGGADVELSETLGDIRAMAYLGAYYAQKIRGATDLALFDASKKSSYQTSAVTHLRQALVEWQNYADILDRQYNNMDISMQGVFDWNATTSEVRKDIVTAQNAR